MESKRVISAGNWNADIIFKKDG